MGFATKRGFAKHVVQIMFKVLIKSGGGQATRTETMLTDEVTELTGGGGKADRTETALTETVVLSLGSL